MRILLEPFLEASDGPEYQELGAGAECGIDLGDPEQCQPAHTLVFLTQQVDCRLSPYTVPKLHVQNLHGGAHDVWCEFRPPVATSWSIQ